VKLVREQKCCNKYDPYTWFFWDDVWVFRFRF